WQRSAAVLWGGEVVFEKGRWGVTTMLLCRVTILAAAGLAVAPASAAPVQPKALPLVGHQGAVSASFAPRGKAIATAGADGTVRVWDVATGVQLHKLDQPGKAVGVAFSPDGKTLLAASTGRPGAPNRQPGALSLRDTVTGKLLWQQTEALGYSGAIAFSP